MKNLLTTVLFILFSIDALTGSVSAQEGCWMVAIRDAHALYDIEATVKKGTKVFMVDREVDSDGTVEVYPLACGCSYDAKNFREIDKCQW